MTIVCSKCGHGITSVIIDRKLALQECLTNLAKHGLRQHPQVVSLIQQAIAKVIAAMTMYMSVTELGVIPEDETYIIEQLEESQKIMMLAAGFDEEEDTEDEEGEDIEEDEEEPPNGADVIEPVFEVLNSEKG